MDCGSFTLCSHDISCDQSYCSRTTCRSFIDGKLTSPKPSPTRALKQARTATEQQVSPSNFVTSSLLRTAKRNLQVDMHVADLLLQIKDRIQRRLKLSSPTVDSTTPDRPIRRSPTTDTDSQDEESSDEDAADPFRTPDSKQRHLALTRKRRNEPAAEYGEDISLGKADKTWPIGGHFLHVGFVRRNSEQR